MKTHINLFVLVSICLATFLLMSMVGCRRHTEVEEVEPVALIQATPANGSTIQKDATIIATFDSTPTGLNVTGGKFTLVGSNVTIVGPFTPGTLNLTLTWEDGTTVLTYIVEAPDIPSLPKGMVTIPAGEFEMGSNDAEADNDEQPVRTVYVDTFYMDETEVTNTQYKEFLLENPQWQKGRVNAKFADANYLNFWNGNNYSNGKGNHPVSYVSWYAAMAYAEWADKRLPTEAEWEYAARGGLEGKKYPNGNTITPADANYDHNAGGTTSVAKYPKNGYGLYDMAGNVWEWCLDEYDQEFYFTFPRDGVARNPLSGANSVAWLMDNFTNVKDSRVLRGGSWSNTERFVRVANRLNNTPTNTRLPLRFSLCEDCISLTLNYLTYYCSNLHSRLECVPKLGYT